MTYHQFTITLPEIWRDQLGKRLIELGSLGVEERDNAVIAYFPETLDHQFIAHELDLLAALLGGLPGHLTVTFEHTVLQHSDWNESWKKSFKPLDVGTLFTILPPWEKQNGDRIPLIIDPGMAFGTGHHGTTRSCLVLMERYAPSVARKRFLDLGTGTGLLAIAARKIGFSKVIGVDTDPLAIEASRKNMLLNRSEGIELFEGDIHAAAGTYDMIAANLISGTLVELAGEIASRSGPSGVVIMSGILEGQNEEVETAAEKAGLRFTERLLDGKWITLAFRH